MEKDKARRFILAGWLLFILSSILFIASAVRNGDWIGLGGSLCFLMANLVFLIPVLKENE